LALVLLALEVELQVQQQRVLQVLEVELQVQQQRVLQVLVRKQ
jgi:hypothetical protein